MSKKIVVVGSLNVDNIMQVPRMPMSGETMALKGLKTAPGGKGANQAVAASRMGATVSFFGAVGNDTNGQFMTTTLLSNQVNVDHVLIKDNVPTGTATILLQDDGANTILINGGANQALTIDDVNHAEDLFKQADIVIAQFEVPESVILASFELAKASGALTILNPAPAVYQLTPALLAVTDIVIPNETEAQLLTGLPVKVETTSLNLVADALKKQGAKQLIITLGDKGAYFSNAKTANLYSPYPVMAVDTTAAGDTFIGTFANIIQSDFDNMDEAIQLASAASALAVTRNGAIPSIPTINEVKEFKG